MSSDALILRLFPAFGDTPVDTVDGLVECLWRIPLNPSDDVLREVLDVLALLPTRPGDQLHRRLLFDDFCQVAELVVRLEGEYNKSDTLIFRQNLRDFVQGGCTNRASIECCIDQLLVDDFSLPPVRWPPEREEAVDPFDVVLPLPPPATSAKAARSVTQSPREVPVLIPVREALRVMKPRRRSDGSAATNSARGRNECFTDIRLGSHLHPPPRQSTSRYGRIAFGEPRLPLVAQNDFRRHLQYHAGEEIRRRVRLALPPRERELQSCSPLPKLEAKDLAMVLLEVERSADPRAPTPVVAHRQRDKRSSFEDPDAMVRRLACVAQRQALIGVDATRFLRDRLRHVKKYESPQ